MTAEFIAVAVAVAILFTIATSVPLGHYTARAFTGEASWLDPVLGPIERLILRVTGVIDVLIVALKLA